jgi:amino-acid N-acetyltransferase
MNLRPPDPSERERMRELLAAHALPTSDFDSKQIAWFVAVDENGTLSGMAGLEVHDDAGLLRSLVATKQGAGTGSLLVAEVERFARARSVLRLCLLTQTAEAFFAQRGYARVPRSDAPPALLATTEFQSLCPASAICMVKTL